MIDGPHSHAAWRPLLRGLGLAAVVVASMGASCSPRLGSPFGVAGPPAPAVLTPTATSADVVAAINQNASRVQTYQAQSASVSMPESVGLPLVSANLAVERPRRFRMRAVTALTGPEVDLGSNDERFWFWARRNEPPALYTARHDAWAASPAAAQLPVDPAWLIDALGLTLLDPNAVYVGPIPRGDGTLELQTQVPGPNGPRQRVLMVDSRTAVVREQHLYDASGTLTASVFADRFRYDPAAAASLPERVRLVVPATGMELTINTGPIVLNAPIADGGQLWSLPQLGDYPTVDLTAPGAGGFNLAASQPIATPFAATESEEPTWRAMAPLRPPTAPPQVAAVAAEPPAQPRFVGLPKGGRALD